MLDLLRSYDRHAPALKADLVPSPFDACGDGAWRGAVSLNVGNSETDGLGAAERLREYCPLVKSGSRRDRQLLISGRCG